jgi:PAS domain-containing protein
MRTAGQPYYEDGRFRGYRGLAFRISGEVHERRLRNQAEREKLQLLAALEMVVAHYPYAIVVFDRELRLLFANENYYEALGIERSELPVGISFTSLFNLLIVRGEFRAGNADDVVHQQVELVRSGRSYSFERSRPNGQILMVHGFALPCGGFVRTFMDVTDRVEAKWTISALQARLR